MTPKESEEIEVADEVEEAEEDYGEEYEERGWSFRKKFFTVLLVIIVIIAAIVGAILLNPNVQDVLILPPRENDDGTGIIIEVQALLAGGGSASGDGELKIVYKGLETYQPNYANQETYSSKLSFSSDYALKVVLYSEFVWDKGEYEIIATFKDKSANYFFDPADNLNFGFADYVNVSLSLEPNENTLRDSESARENPIYIHALARIRDYDETTGVERNPSAPPSDTLLEVTIAHEGGTRETYDETLKGSSEATFDEFVYYSSTGGTGSGYYTVSAKITNNNVNPSSPKYQIDLPSLRKEFLNVGPIANAGEDQNENPDTLGGTTATVNFDGSKSWNDGEITKYIWDFDYSEDIGFDPDEETTSPTTSHTYERTAIIDTYDVALQVIGDVKDSRLGLDEQGNVPVEFSFIDTVRITVNWLS
ncbi:MAG: hypothetical protein JSV49_12485 [Thermoplasmata archaeon]|nr:MAG: hypothetical protein JSV49_12485 [Thermoplasmata archaeon]